MLWVVLEVVEGHGILVDVNEGVWGQWKVGGAMWVDSVVIVVGDPFEPFLALKCVHSMSIHVGSWSWKVWPLAASVGVVVGSVGWSPGGNGQWVVSLSGLW